ncbi:SRPBCC family protein [Mycolicibacterium sp. 050158]|jgi:Polyketide cyclase / dehydrase and lipid transport|uniref:SRPBCC family protein n=1 Tax=Mycolicibacterium sp. 050158 TaxID=3090602 RepID=UPI00299D6995|nr:SRPBCC family protein [Mycolicibacterium sp. 050158]MDX1890464.1 SRPBCC family protein [Mycolicibacterium sp. 050158]
MAHPTVVEQSRAIPVTQEAAFAGTAPIELPTLFARWYGPIPPIKAVREQTGDWDAVGQTRTVVLTGGGSMREELVSYDPPASFGYRLSDVTGPLAPLVDHVEGLWTFTPAGTGTRVTWRWTIHPRTALAAPLLPVFGKLWLGYARQSLEGLSNQLVG